MTDNPSCEKGRKYIYIYIYNMILLPDCANPMIVGYVRSKRDGDGPRIGEGRRDLEEEGA